MVRALTLCSLLVVGTLAVGAEAAQPLSGQEGRGLPQTVARSQYAAQDAEFVLVNNTSVWLSLFIDGSRSVSVPPGDQGVDLVTPGNHNFRAETLDGTGRYVTHSGYVPPEGKTWTVSEE